MMPHNSTLGAPANSLPTTPTNSTSIFDGEPLLPELLITTAPPALPWVPPGTEHSEAPEYVPNTDGIFRGLNALTVWRDQDGANPGEEPENDYFWFIDTNSPLPHVPADLTEKGWIRLVSAKGVRIYFNNGIKLMDNLFDWDFWREQGVTLPEIYSRAGRVAFTIEEARLKQQEAVEYVDEDGDSIIEW